MQSKFDVLKSMHVVVKGLSQEGHALIRTEGVGLKSLRDYVSWVCSVPTGKNAVPHNVLFCISTQPFHVDPQKSEFL